MPPKKPAPKLYASSEGRFTIIDELAKDNSDSDVDSPIPVPAKVSQKPLRCFSRSVDCRPSSATPPTTPSRFRIVPLESKYRRGRWNCFDYYERSTAKLPKPKIPDSTPLRQPSNHHRLRTLIGNYSQQGDAHTIHSTTTFDASSESDRENSDVFAKSTPTFSRTAVPVAPTKLRSHDASSLSRRMHDERLQKGLEKSLNPSEARNRTNPRRYDLFSSSCASSMNCMGQTSTAAIDSKIEQAMVRCCFCNSNDFVILTTATYVCLSTTFALWIPVGKEYCNVSYWLPRAVVK
ncbi:hypothetical protein Y032_0654g1188 [Ancylostoma ceylanicum]|uniref:Uncharacterized protein n=1 Tax=Ancylostoma ceylanicum TaxID=53326 RepID=A0A016WI58_9BILA|nr:hypothetical protein Y032_0654g1188 [Ancylostoma ceylanicum]